MGADMGAHLDFHFSAIFLRKIKNKPLSFNPVLSLKESLKDNTCKI